MSLVSDVIADIRVEIDDTDSSRFADDTTIILPIVKQAIRRANRICQRAEIHFAKKKAALVTVALQDYVNLPADFDIPIALFRDDLHSKIEFLAESDWEEVVIADELTFWQLDYENSKILLNAAPATVINLTFWYYPKVDPSAYTTSSTMPWGGRLDDAISRYAALRLQNIDEQNTAQDQTILQDLESSIVSTYEALNPSIRPRKGWL